MLLSYKPRYYAFFHIEGGVFTKSPIRYTNESFAKRGIRKEAKAHLVGGETAHWSVHLPSGKTVAAGGWKEGVQFSVPDDELHRYDKPEIE